MSVNSPVCMGARSLLSPLSAVPHQDTNAIMNPFAHNVPREQYCWLQDGNLVVTRESYPSEPVLGSDFALIQLTLFGSSLI